MVERHLYALNFKSCTAINVERIECQDRKPLVHRLTRSDCVRLAVEHVGTSSPRCRCASSPVPQYLYEHGFTFSPTAAKGNFVRLGPFVRLCKVHFLRIADLGADRSERRLSALGVDRHERAHTCRSLWVATHQCSFPGAVIGVGVMIQWA
jgi:hypothetical protein